MSIWSGRCGFWDVRRSPRSIDPGSTRRRHGTIGNAMKLCRFGPPGAEKPGLLLEDGTRLDASGCTPDYDEAFFAGGGIDALGAWLNEHRASAPRIHSGVRIGAP